MKSSLAFALAAAAALLAGAAGAATDVSWTADYMNASGDSVVTNGSLVYAYCQSNQGRAVTNEVHTVPFVGLQDITPSGDFCFEDNWGWTAFSAAFSLAAAQARLRLRLAPKQRQPAVRPESAPQPRTARRPL